MTNKLHAEPSLEEWLEEVERLLKHVEESLIVEVDGRQPPLPEGREVGQGD